MLTNKQIESLNIGINTEDPTAVLQAQAAIEWLADHTKINTTQIEKLPACAKLFIVKFCEINNLQSGVASESIEGLSQSFNTSDKESMLWDIANTLLGSYLISRVRFVVAQDKWIYGNGKPYRNKETDCLSHRLEKRLDGTLEE